MDSSLASLSTSASNVISPSRVSAGPVNVPMPSVPMPSPLPSTAQPSAAMTASEARLQAELEFQAWASHTQPEQRPLNLGGPAPTANIAVTAIPAIPPPAPTTSPPKFVPANVIFQQAEERLLETEKRVRAEQEQLESERNKRLHTTEVEAVKMKTDVLKEIEEQEEEWTKRKKEQQQMLDSMKVQLEERETRLRLAESEHQEELMKADDDLKRRSLSTEEARRRITQALEAKLRKEIENELEPHMRITMERELTHNITLRVQGELQAKFEEMCTTMKMEVDKAREKMQVEIEHSLTPVIEARLLPALRAQAEHDVQRSIIQQLQETSTAAARLRDELQGTIQEREALRDELQAKHLTHEQEATSLGRLFSEEKERTKLLSEELVVARETLERFSDERKLYPLLKEVENIPAPWSHVNQQLDVLKKENSKLQADAQFSAHEIDMLRTQLMQNLGNATPAQPAPLPATTMNSAPQSPRVSPTRRQHVAVPLNFSTPPPQQLLVQMDSTGTLDPKSAVNRSMSFDSPQELSRHKSLTSDATAPKVPHKNRFRHTPSKDSNTPTFPFKKEDRERIFFAEMEHLKEQTVQDQRARKAAKKVTTPARTPRTNSRKRA